MLRFRRMQSLQKFASLHSSVHARFDQEPTLSNRDIYQLNHADALAEWRSLSPN